MYVVEIVVVSLLIECLQTVNKTAEFVPNDERLTFCRAASLRLDLHDSCVALLLIMFARTAVRAVTKPSAFRSVRTAVTIAPSASEVHAMNPHGLEISKAQGIAKNGLVSGMLCRTVEALYRC